MKILTRGQNEKEWQLVESVAYDKEGALQHLLAESPGLISIADVRPNAGPLVLAVREFGLPIGSIDLLAFTAEGDIAVIECKLAANAEVKRKVIGQVLEYGANLWEMRYEELDQGIRLRMGDSLAELVEKAVQSAEWDEENFRSNIEASLVSGNFILIIVVDEINEELARIVRFMNVCGNPSFDFAALEMRRFKSDNTEILVPRVFGPALTAKSSASSGPTRQWDEASFFAELQSQQGEEAVIVARRILEWGQQNANIWWGKGKRSGSFVPYFYHKEKQHQLAAVFTYGSLEIYFQFFSSKPPFDNEEKRLELLNRLNQIDGVNIPRERINSRPSIRLSNLAIGKRVEQLLAVYDWVVDEIKKS